MNFWNHLEQFQTNSIKLSCKSALRRKILNFGVIFWNFWVLALPDFFSLQCLLSKNKVFCLFSNILQFLGAEKLTLPCKKVHFSTACEYFTKFPWNWRFLKLTRVWPPDLSSVSRDKCIFNICVNCITKEWTLKEKD